MLQNRTENTVMFVIGYHYQKVCCGWLSCGTIFSSTSTYALQAEYCIVGIPHNTAI